MRKIKVLKKSIMKYQTKNFIKKYQRVRSNNFNPPKYQTKLEAFMSVGRLVNLASGTN